MKECKTFYLFSYHNILKLTISTQRKRYFIHTHNLCMYTRHKTNKYIFLNKYIKHLKQIADLVKLSFHYVNFKHILHII